MDETHAPLPQADANRLVRLAQHFELSPPQRVLTGNHVGLLVNGQMYFPKLLDAINAATYSIWLETYIFAPDNIGTRFEEALTKAAQRGVDVRVVIDGYGGGEYARRLAVTLGKHGGQVKIYRPERWWRFERDLLRRLHRKLVVIDDVLAFVGGINIIDDYNYRGAERKGNGLGPRFDFAVMLQGPIVAQVAQAARKFWWSLSLAQRLTEEVKPPPTLRAPVPIDRGVAAQLLLRDNLRHRHTIERAYLAEIEASRKEILIACAYFLPGRRLRGALLAAVNRGVRVRLLLQGHIEYAIQHYAQRSLYAHLLDEGIEIYEYKASYLHAKVAVVDELWATVGSSNIDPYSLLLAREANVVVYDAQFAGELKSVLDHAIDAQSQRVHLADYAARGPLAKIVDWVSYRLVRFAIVVLAQGRGY